MSGALQWGQKWCCTVIGFAQCGHTGWSSTEFSVALFMRLSADGDPNCSVYAEISAIRTRVRIARKGEPTASPPSPLAPEVMEPIEAIVAEMWPGVTVVPVMSTGATDGLYARNAGIPVYGAGAIFDDPEDSRSHSRDERVAVRRFYEALEFWNRLARRMSR